MARLSLAANPTFRAKVGIPVAGGDSVDVEFEFRHRTTKELAKFVENSDRDDIDTVMDCVCGWELEDEFSRANVERLLDNYGGSAMQIYTKYIEELVGQRRKN